MPAALLSWRRDLFSLAGPSCIACSTRLLWQGMPGCLRNVNMWGSALTRAVRIACPPPYPPAISSTCLSSSRMAASSAVSMREIL